MLKDLEWKKGTNRYKNRGWKEAPLWTIILTGQNVRMVRGLEVPPPNSVEEEIKAGDIKWIVWGHSSNEWPSLTRVQLRWGGVDYHVLSGWWGLNTGPLPARPSHVSFYAVLALTCLVSINFWLLGGNLSLGGVNLPQVTQLGGDLQIWSWVHQTLLPKCVLLSFSVLSGSPTEGTITYVKRLFFD